MKQSNRRGFLMKSAAVAAAAPAAALGANDRIRVGICGLRGRGKSLIAEFHALGKDNVEIVAMCDCDDNVLGERVGGYEELSGKKMRTYKDMRKMLDQSDIDVVGFATPNHWHSLGAIWALRAGKHVYVEKPGSHNIFEGRQVVEAAKKYKKVLQHGTQNRSSPNIVEGMRKLKEGAIGRVYLARGIAYKKRQGFQKINEKAIPAGLDWDMWQGPAPYRAFAPERHRGWHLMFDYGNGDLGNQGVHELDMIRWGLDLNTHPTKVASMGGTYVDLGAQQYPQVQTIMYEWEGRDLLVTFENRSGYTNAEAGMGKEFIFLDKRNAVG
ncbi:MAG: Gfo/Idh/MocA family oxidoreductase, partial [bacterium]|nr:Gfo/Idh/MocA family oxidoreductase [bacterium]